MFNDEDMLLGTAEHNRPLYITATIKECEVRRILIDPGSSINIITLRTLQSLQLSVKHLTNEKITIYGFNSNSSRALGSINLIIQTGELQSEAKFHVLNADTSY